MPAEGIKKLVTDIIFGGDVLFSVLTKPSHSIHCNTQIPEPNVKKTAPNQSRTNFLLVNFAQTAEGGAGSGSSGGAIKNRVSKFVRVRYC